MHKRHELTSRSTHGSVLPGHNRGAIFSGRDIPAELLVYKARTGKEDGFARMRNPTFQLLCRFDFGRNFVRHGRCWQIGRLEVVVYLGGPSHSTAGMFLMLLDNL